MFPASTHTGQSVLGFPDVCKSPVVPIGTVPIAYPNIGTTSTKTATKTTTKTATKTAYKSYTKPAMRISGGNVAGLKRQLTVIHQKIMSMPGDNATQWHALLDDYVMTTAEVFTALTSNRR